LETANELLIAIRPGLAGIVHGGSGSSIASLGINFATVKLAPGVTVRPNK
jgi:hypothetical protein